MNEVEKKGIGKLGISLIICATLVGLLVVSSIWFYVRNNDLQNMVNALETETYDLQSQVGNLTSEKSNLQNQVESLTTNNTVLQSHVDILTIENEYLQSEVDLLEMEIDDFYDFSFVLNMSWTDGFGGIYDGPWISARYSRVFITMHPIDISEGSDATVNVTLRNIFWAPTDSVNYGDEWITQTLTIYRHQTTQFAWLRPVPYEIKTKAPRFGMEFFVESTVSSGWVLMDIYVYQRNE